MNITNGSVSRTVKPADYEARTVTLSFTVDPGDDVQVALEHLSFMCEKHARATPSLDTAPVALAIAAAEPVGTTKQRQTRRPPVVESTARVAPEPVGPTEPSNQVVQGAGSASTEASVSSTDTAAPPTETAGNAEKEITNQDLGSAIAATHSRLAREHETLRGDDVEIQKRRAELIISLRDKITGSVGMPVAQMDQAQRKLFVAGLATLAPAGNGPAAEQLEAY